MIIINVSTSVVSFCLFTGRTIITNIVIYLISSPLPVCTEPDEFSEIYHTCQLYKPVFQMFVSRISHNLTVMDQCRGYQY